MEIISIAEATQIMNSGSLFSVEFVTYDSNRNKGGTIRYYDQVKLSTRDDDFISNKEKSIKSKPSKSYENSTRNVVVFNNGKSTGIIKKFHIFLMLKFNDKKVVL